MVDVTYEDYQDLVRKLSLANERARDLQERVSGRDARIAALEAENARLKAEVERLRELASELPILKYAMPAIKARLAEALKALEPFAKVAPVFDHQRIPAPCEDHHTVYRWATKGTGEVEITVADFRAARRVREGGKVK